MNWYRKYVVKLAQNDEEQGIFDFHEEENTETEEQVPKNRETYIKLVSTNSYGEATFVVDEARYTFKSSDIKFISTIKWLSKPQNGGDKVAFNWARKNCRKSEVIDQNGYRGLLPGQ